MNDRINESDLLALIEGELPADRRAIVGEALRTDAELRRRVEGMIRDAQSLAHDRTDPPAAPSGAIARAFEHASQPVATIARPSKRRFAMAAIITLAMVGVWGAILYATFAPGGNSTNPVTQRPQRFPMIDEDQARHLAGVLNPPEIAQYLDPPEGTETLGERIVDNDVDLAADIQLDPEIEQMLTDFASLASDSTPLEQLAPRVEQLIALDPRGLSVQDIVIAARQGRLRILTEKREPADLLAASPRATGTWAARTTQLSPDTHEFVRDYAKPAPGSEHRAPTRSEQDATLTRLDIALTSASSEAARDRETARFLNDLVTRLTRPDGSATGEYLWIVIEGSPIETGPQAEASDGWRASLPEDATVFPVYLERAAASE